MEEKFPNKIEYKMFFFRKMVTEDLNSQHNEQQERKRFKVIW